MFITLSGVLLIFLLLYTLPIYLIPLFSSLLTNYYFIVDSLSFWLSFLVLVLIFARALVVPNLIRAFLLILFLLTLSCYLVFNSSELLRLYVAYELSLVPILYIIIKGGDYPDRSLRACFMLIYTSVFSFPFMVYVISSMLAGGSCSFLLYTYYSWGFSPYVVVLAYSTFLVKLPIYGLHYWLPMAHVEAPTYGSMILAGLLLKMGGCGLFRIRVFIANEVFNQYFVSYLLFSMVFSSLVCCVQSDFKRLVAYSSVAHIIVVALAVVLSSNLRIRAFIIVMVAHGVSSPLLFILVGVLYQIYGSRILVLYRGLMSSIPIVSLFLVLCFVLSVPVPPSLAFLGEVQFATSLVHFYWVSIVVILLFVFLGVLYNLLWLGSVFGPSESFYFMNTAAWFSIRDFFVMLMLVFLSCFILFFLI